MAYSNSSTLFRTVPSPTPYGLLFNKIAVRNPHPKLRSLLSEEGVKYKLQMLCAHSEDRSEQQPIKNFRKNGRGRTHGLSKIFWTAIYRAHRAVIFAIAQLSCSDFLTLIVMHDP